MEKVKEHEERVKQEPVNPIRHALFQALGSAKNVYLATKLNQASTFALWSKRAELQKLFPGVAMQFPDEYHLTWSFLGTKSPEQLQAFHDKLVGHHSMIAGQPLAFNQVKRMRSFVDGKVIVYLAPSETDSANLLQFWQALRMEEWKPKRAKDEFTPHITLAQLPATITDEQMAVLPQYQDHISNVVVPFDSLWFFGKGNREKVTMQLY